MNEKNPTAPKQPWVPPTIKDSGTVAQILQGGGGKISGGVDTGDTRKAKGQG